MKRFPNLARLKYWIQKWCSPRRLAFVTATVATLVAGIYIVENWRGERAWAAAQDRLRGAGEPLSLKEYLPPPPPDELNFMMNEVLVRRFGFGRTNPVDKQPWEWEPGSRSEGQGSFPYDAMGSSDGNFKLDLPALAAALPPALVPVPPVTEQDAASAILRWTEQWKADFDILLDAAKHRPASHLPLDWTNNELQEVWKPMDSWLDGPKVLQFRALAQVGAGDADGARDSILIGLRLAEACAAEPLFLLNWVLSMATSALMERPLHEGLGRQLWGDSDLLAVQQALDRLEIRSGLRRAWRGERVRFTEIIESGIILRLVGVVDHHRVALTVAAIGPRGWLRQNQAKAVVWQLDHGSADRNHGVASLFPAEPQRDQWSRPHDFLFRIMVQGSSGVEETAWSLESRLNLAKAAIVLEKHRLRAGRYPGSMDELAADLVSELPGDPFSGRSLRFVVAGDKPRIWSVGPNGRDDGGTDTSDDIFWAYPAP